tara:strand:+ start:299 stop:502 length:204 start_codon:yes stop_codon:yes gene_type:complete
MKQKLSTVREHEGLVRDERTRAVLNTDLGALKLYKEQRAKNNEIKELKNEVEDIKNMLSEILSKLEK